MQLTLEHVGVAETWLKDGDVATLDGYSWFGHNRQALSRKAVRGSGGVGVFVRNALLNDWAPGSQHSVI